MAHPSSTLRADTHNARVWRRRARRPWNRPHDGGHFGGLLSELPSLPRAALARLTMLMIDRMDELDGDLDLDLESNGDELDGHNSEDEFMEHSDWLGIAGCPIADPDLAVDDGACDPDFEDQRDGDEHTHDREQEEAYV